MLRCWLPPGDIVLLTAAVRDVMAAYPGRFAFDVRTTAAGLWQHFPGLAAFREEQRGVEPVEISLPSTHLCNERPMHLLQWMLEEVNGKLGTRATCRAFHGEVHLSPEERRRSGPLRGPGGMVIPYWLIVAGGKPDHTIKWWSAPRYQEVVDRLRGRIQFVQVGEASDAHPALSGVVDLRGRTDIRELVRWMHHAQGVLCGITFAMHLAAAVDNAWTGRRGRPCVVIAGGREPVHWFAYPGHQILHTVGQLPCAGTGCWKARTIPLGDGSEWDEPGRLCTQPVGGLARCMDMITASDVVRRIEGFLDGGACRALTPSEATVARALVDCSGRERIPGEQGAPAPRFPWGLQPVFPTPRDLLAPRGSGGGTRRPATATISPERLCVVTLCDTGMADVGRESIPRMRAYARRHGFAFRQFRRRLVANRHPSWSKVEAVLRLIRSGRFDWVLWVDADAFILNTEHDVRRLITGCHDLITASDFNGLCCGVFLCRACPWSERFLETAMGLGDLGHDQDSHGPKWEQSAFKHILAHFPEHQRHVAVAPETWLNSSPISYRPGHFVLHLGAMTNEERLRTLRRILAEPHGSEDATTVPETEWFRRRIELIPAFATPHSLHGFRAPGTWRKDRM